MRGAGEQGRLDYRPEPLPGGILHGQRGACDCGGLGTGKGLLNRCEFADKGRHPYNGAVLVPADMSMSAVKRETRCLMSNGKRVLPPQR